QASSHRPPKITPFAGGDVNRTGDARLRSSSRSAGSCKRGRVLLDGGFGGLLLGLLDGGGGLGGGGGPVRPRGAGARRRGTRGGALAGDAGLELALADPPPHLGRAAVVVSSHGAASWPAPPAVSTGAEGELGDGRDDVPGAELGPRRPHAAVDVSERDRAEIG